MYMYSVVQIIVSVARKKAHVLLLKAKTIIWQSQERASGKEYMKPRHDQRVIIYYINFSLILKRKKTKKPTHHTFWTDKMLVNHFLKHKSSHCCSQTEQEHGPFQEQHRTVSMSLNYILF